MSFRAKLTIAFSSVLLLTIFVAIISWKGMGYALSDQQELYQLKCWFKTNYNNILLEEKSYQSEENLSSSRNVFNLIELVDKKLQNILQITKNKKQQELLINISDTLNQYKKYFSEYVQSCINQQTMKSRMLNESQKLMEITTDLKKSNINAFDVSIAINEALSAEIQYSLYNNDKTANDVLRYIEQIILVGESIRKQTKNEKEALYAFRISSFAYNYKIIFNQFLEIDKQKQKSFKLMDLQHKKFQKDINFFIDEATKIEKRQIDNLVKVINFTSIIAVLIGIFTTLFMSQQITRPVNQLIDSTRKIVKGDWNINLVINSNDEIGELARNFNYMTDKLKKNIRELEIYQRDLQSMVDIKTRDLESKIYELKQTEKKLRRSREMHKLFFDNSPLGIIHYNTFGVITRINEAMIKLLKIDDEIKNFKSFANQELSEEILKSLKGEHGYYSGYLKLEKSNNEIFIQSYWFPILEDNEIISGVGFVEDITKRKQAQELIIQNEKMLSVGGLAAGMAHEINNPLAGIMQNTQVIERRLFEKSKKNLEVANHFELSLDDMKKYLYERDINKMLDAVLKSGARAALIVRNMLNFSRTSSESKTNCSIIDLLENSLSLAENDFNLTKQYDFRNIIIKRNFEKKIPIIKCESNEIQQVFLNIIRNGAEAMSQKKRQNYHPQFDISVKYDNNNIVIKIRDNGPGIDDQVKKRIFEPFFTTKPVGIGTGLGMSVSYFIIHDKHNGEMKVESKLGEWTEFIISLPV